MQIFGINSHPDKGVCEFYDCHVPRLATEACELLYGRAHLEHQPWLSDQVPGPDGEYLYTWKAISKGHAKHPCFLWVCANRKHAWWALQHALSICREYTQRYGKKTITEYHLEFILKHTQPPPEEPNDKYSIEDFEVFLTHVYPTNPEKVVELMGKTCTKNPPEGCAFGILACNAEFEVVACDGQRDWVASYRNYYASKKDSFKLPHVHCKRKRQVYEFEK